MGEFLSNYGIWILLGLVFLTMHRVGGGCCGHSYSKRGESVDTKDERGTAGEAPVARPQGQGDIPDRGRGGCH